MNVLLVTTRFTYNCGMSTYINILARDLHLRDHTVGLAALNSRRSQDLAASGVPFYPISLDQSAKTPVQFVRNFRILDRIVHQDKIQIVNAFHRWGAFVSWFVCRLRHVPLVSTDLTTLTGKSCLSLWGDHVITYSNFGKQYLIDNFSLPASKISVVYNPVSQSSATPTEIERVRVELNLNSDQIIISVGRLEPQKAQIDLVHAANIVLRRHPRALFLIVGDGSLRGTLEQTIESLHLSDRVRLLGARDDTSAIMASCHIFAMSSAWEGIPLAMLDAMEVGLPVVVTVVGGVPEVLAMGEGKEMGNLVLPHEPALLAESICELLDDPIKARAMGRVGQKVVRTRLTGEQMVSGAIDVYKRLLGGTK